MLDLHDRSPVLIWGNHQSGKSFALVKAFKEAGFHDGVVHVLLDSDKETAGERLRQQLGAPGHAEVEEALKQAAKTLGRLPIVVLEIPRQVSEMKVLASCSGLAKTLCYDKELAKLIVLASSASMALSFDADAREVRLQIASLSEEECQQEKAGRPFAESVPLFGMLPDQVQEFLKHHGGDAAVEHKADLLQLTGGNVGKLEALGVKRGACALLCRAFPASQELAKNLKIQTFEQVRQEAMGQQDGFVLCLFFCVFFAICQVKEIKRFLGIDMQGGFGPEKVPAAKEVARRVADSPFHQCVRAEDFAGPFHQQTSSTGGEGSRRPLHLCQGHH